MRAITIDTYKTRPHLQEMPKPQPGAGEILIRLHTAGGEAHLLRMPISHLEERWAAHGFVRIHRSYLVPVGHIAEFSVAGNNHSVKVSGEWLPVSRRHARDVRDRLLRAGRRP